MANQKHLDMHVISCRFLLATIPREIWQQVWLQFDIQYLTVNFPRLNNLV